MSIKIVLGSGTKIARGPITMKNLGMPTHDLASPSTTLIEIRQTIEVSCVVGVDRGVRGACLRCGVEAPLPDEAGLAFILRNHDGERLVFPEPEGCEPERDRYPLTGWRDLSLGDEGGFFCPACVKAIESFASKRVPRKVAT